MKHFHLVLGLLLICAAAAVWPCAISHAEDLPLSVAADGRALIFDNERHEVGTITEDKFGSILSGWNWRASMGRMEGLRNVKSCTLSVTFTVDFYGVDDDIVGAACQVESAGGQRSAIICASALKTDWQPIDNPGIVNKVDLITFMARSCATPDVELTPSGEEISSGERSFSVLDLNSEALSERISTFQDELEERHVSGRILHCQKGLTIPVGVANGNFSYGALCQLGDGSKISDIAICDDEMVGHFKIRTLSDHTISRRDLALFVADYCFGG